MTSHGDSPRRLQRRRQGVSPPAFTLPDSDYSPGLGQIVVEREGTFQGTRSRVAIPSYDQPSTSEGATLPGTMRHVFQWLDGEPECNGYASSCTISPVQLGFVSGIMADNNNTDLCHLMEA